MIQRMPVRRICIAALFLLVCFSFTNVFSQKLPVFQKKIYVSPDQKIYVNKSLPLYFFISDSKNPQSAQVRLKSETLPRCTNPMYMPHEGTNLIWSPSAVDTTTRKVVYPKRNIQFQIYADARPPVTRIIYSQQRERYANGIHYLPDSVTIHFEATDDLSGVETTYFSIDSEAYIPFTHPVKLTSEMKYTIHYFSVDHTGNAEPVKVIRISTDRTPPVSKMSIVGQTYKNIVPGNAKIILSATDNISGVKNVYFSIDDSTFHTYKYGINTVYLRSGDHKLYYYATDNVNNREKVNTYAFYVDKTPPQVIEEILGKTFLANGREYSAGTSKLRITSFDNKAGVKDIYYSINKAPYVKYVKPIELSGHHGSLFVTSYAVDRVGNKSLVDKSGSKKNLISYIDLTGPWLGHSFDGPTFTNRDTVFISQKTRIELEAKDTESGVDRIEYQADSGDLETYHVPFQLSKEGIHHVSVYGYDHTENMTRQVFEVVVDTTGPRIFERFSSPPIGTQQVQGQKPEVYPSTVVLFLSATDSRTGFKSMWYKLNHQTEQPYTREIRGFAKGKINTLEIRATDMLGNQSLKTIEFSIQ